MMHWETYVSNLGAKVAYSRMRQRREKLEEWKELLKVEADSTLIEIQKLGKLWARKMLSKNLTEGEKLYVRSALHSL